jgi:ribonuclease G
LSNELIISATQDGCRIALLKDKTLVEFHNEEEGSKFTVGDIYLGLLKWSGLNATFIDVGYDKDALPHLDLGPLFSSLQKFTSWFGEKINGKLDKSNRTSTNMGKSPAMVERPASSGTNCQRANFNEGSAIIL